MIDSPFRLGQYELGGLVHCQYKDFGAWKTARKFSLTASESAKLTGVSCYTPYEEWLDEKTGRTEREAFDERTQTLVDCGSELERFIRYRIEWEYPRFKGQLVPTGPYSMYARRVQARDGNAFWVSATPDLMVRDSQFPSRQGHLTIRVGSDERVEIGTPVELKVSSPYLWRKGPPADYPAQLQHQMMVLNQSDGLIFALLSDSRRREKWGSMTRVEALDLFCSSTLKEFPFTKEEDTWLTILQASDKVSRQLQAVHGSTPTELKF